MPRARLELARLAAQAPKTCVAANFTTSANFQFLLANLEFIELNTKRQKREEKVKSDK